MHNISPQDLALLNGDPETPLVQDEGDLIDDLLPAAILANVTGLKRHRGRWYRGDVNDDELEKLLLLARSTI